MPPVVERDHIAPGSRNSLSTGSAAAACSMRLARAPHAQLGRGHRRADELGDLGERAAIDLVQREREPRRRRQLVEHRVEPLHAIARELAARAGRVVAAVPRARRRRRSDRSARGARAATGSDTPRAPTRDRSTSRGSPRRASRAATGTPGGMPLAADRPCRGCAPSTRNRLAWTRPRWRRNSSRVAAGSPVRHRSTSSTSSTYAVAVTA